MLVPSDLQLDTGKVKKLFLRRAAVISLVAGVRRTPHSCHRLRLSGAEVTKLKPAAVPLRPRRISYHLHQVRSSIICDARHYPSLLAEKEARFVMNAQQCR
jgi:hypothetical protein